MRKRCLDCGFEENVHFAGAACERFRPVGLTRRCFLSGFVATPFAIRESVRKRALIDYYTKVTQENLRHIINYGVASREVLYVDEGSVFVRDISGVVLTVGKFEKGELVTPKTIRSAAEYEKIMSVVRGV